MDAENERKPKIEPAPKPIIITEEQMTAAGFATICIASGITAFSMGNVVGSVVAFAMGAAVATAALL
jgi:hypothetical protein